MKFLLALYHFCIRMMIFLVSFLTSIAYFFHNNTPKYDLSLFLTLITVLPICYCSRVAQTATDFADASHSKSAKSAATTISYGIFSSENAYPYTVTPIFIISSELCNCLLTNPPLFSIIPVGEYLPAVRLNV